MPLWMAVNDIKMHGPMVVLPRLCLLWDVTSFEDITLDSLSAVMVSDPLIGECFPRPWPVDSA